MREHALVKEIEHEGMKMALLIMATGLPTSKLDNQLQHFGLLILLQADHAIDG